MGYKVYCHTNPESPCRLFTKSLQIESDAGSGPAISVLFFSELAFSNCHVTMSDENGHSSQINSQINKMPQSPGLTRGLFDICKIIADSKQIPARGSGIWLKAF